MFTRIVSLVVWLCCAQTLFAQSINIEELIQSGSAITPDYGFEFIQAEPGTMVLHGWADDHKYFEGMGWTSAQYCDAFRLHPHNQEQFGHLFTSQQGCSNPGFNKLPAHALWAMPAEYTVHTAEQLRIDLDHRAVLAEVQDHIFPVTLDRSIAAAALTHQAYEASPAVFLEEASGLFAAHDLEVVAIEQSYQARAVNTGNGQNAITEIRLESSEASFDGSQNPLILPEFSSTRDAVLLVAVALAGVILGAFSLAAGAVIAKRMDKNDKIPDPTALTVSNALSRQRTYYDKDTELLRENTIRVTLPGDLIREDGAGYCDLTVLQWRGDIGFSDAVIHVPESPGIILATYDGVGNRFNIAHILSMLGERSPRGSAARAYYRLKRNRAAPDLHVVS